MKKYISLLLVSAVVLSFAGATLAEITPPPPTLPEDKEQCKEGGWNEFDGVFNNQGDCVSFVVTDGGNPPSGQ